MQQVASSGQESKYRHNAKGDMIITNSIQMVRVLSPSLQLVPFSPCVTVSNPGAEVASGRVMSVEGEGALLCVRDIVPSLSLTLPNRVEEPRTRLGLPIHSCLMNILQARKDK